MNETRKEGLILLTMPLWIIPMLILFVATIVFGGLVGYCQMIFTGKRTIVDALDL